MEEKQRELLQIIDRAHAAFEAVMQEATDEGLWDLHVALEKGNFSSPEGQARLVRGTWGNVGDSDRGTLRFRTACPLNAIFSREAERSNGGLQGAIRLSEMAMRRHSFTAADFYRAWDTGLLSQKELLRRIDRHLTARTLSPRNPRSA